jgi:hypothetical protein
MRRLYKTTRLFVTRETLGNDKAPEHATDVVFDLASVVTIARDIVDDDHPLGPGPDRVIIETRTGLRFVVTDSMDDVVKAWESYLNGALFPRN